MRMSSSATSTRFCRASSMAEGPSLASSRSYSPLKTIFSDSRGPSSSSTISSVPRLRGAGAGSDDRVALSSDIVRENTACASELPGDRRSVCRVSEDRRVSRRKHRAALRTTVAVEGFPRHTRMVENTSFIVGLAFVLILARWLAELGLSQLNRRHVRGRAKQIPGALREVMDDATYAAIRALHARPEPLQPVQRRLWHAALVGVLFSGVLPWGCRTHAAATSARPPGPWRCSCLWWGWG